MITTTNKLFGFSVARRSTRRILVVVYWLCIAAFTCAFLFDQMRHTLDVFGIIIALQILTNLPSLLGGVRAGGVIKPYRGVKWAPLMDRDEVQTVFSGARPVIGSATAADLALDERETRLRDRVHFVSYTLMRWITLFLFAGYALLALLRPEWTRQAGLFLFILLALVLWSLPQTLILWNEPDMSATDMEEPR
ncbi:MAG TPA: hypothetical protein VMA71_05370 [Alloacidobacterium sp.]|nr:hypothetical protein [Alloacidobacterium sp.]